MYHSLFTQDEPILLLRNAIVEQACRDYLFSIVGGYQEQTLKKFFIGKWFGFLLDMDAAGERISGEEILLVLEEKKRTMDKKKRTAKKRFDINGINGEE